MTPTSPTFDGGQVNAMSNTVKFSNQYFLRKKQVSDSEFSKDSKYRRCFFNAHPTSRQFPTNPKETLKGAQSSEFFSVCLRWQAKSGKVSLTRKNLDQYQKTGPLLVSLPAIGNR